MNKQEIREKVYQQLAIDYHCTIEDIMDRKNHFTVFVPQEGRRTYKWDENLFLKVIVINNKIVATGKKEIIEKMQDLFGDAKGEWFMEARSLVKLEKLIEPYHYQMINAHPFFIAYEKSEVACPFEIQYLNHDQIMLLKDNKDYANFDNAFTFALRPSDEIGIVAYDHGKVIGVAGASSDSKTMWQVGIDVDPSYQGRHIATILVTLLKNAIIDQGAIPFYGTAMSHIYSQNVAIHSGFYPMWAELITKNIDEENLKK